MKKFLLSLLGLVGMCSLSAKSYMYIDLKDSTVKYDANDVLEVTFEEIEEVESGVSVSGIHGGYEYVDLGLESEIMWATYNVGATKFGQGGLLYSWGETESRIRKDYSWTKYKWSDGPGEETLTKYCIDKRYGPVDNIRELLPEDDAATANWKGDWRMPSLEEVNELNSNCSWKWVLNYENSGLNGLVGTSSVNGNIIFLPQAPSIDINGYEWDVDLYWTRDLYEGRTSLANSFLVEESAKSIITTTHDTRYVTHCVRAVFLGERKDAGTYMFVYLSNGSRESYLLDDVMDVRFEDEPDYEYVDLGLSVNWATCNVGATKPEEYGDFFAWGETKKKNDYSVENSLTYKLSEDALFSNGIVDSDGRLTPAYDAATANWGDDWRMPSYEEIRELVQKCNWTLTELNGVAGYKVESKQEGNNNWIFIPFAGYHYYTNFFGVGTDGLCWSSECKPVSSSLEDEHACFLATRYGEIAFSTSPRMVGVSVRAVREKE